MAASFTMPELRVDDFQTYHREARAHQPDVYANLGLFCYAAFTNQYPSFRRLNVMQGFKVVSRLIGQAAQLYPLHIEAQANPASPLDLQNILLNSADTPRRFANLPNDVNKEVEGYFGLLDASNFGLASLATLYRFEPNTCRGTLFIADDNHFAAAVGQAYSTYPTADFRRKCPMMELTTGSIWPSAVNLAATTPEAFAESLEPAPSAI